MADIAHDLFLDLMQADRTPGHPGVAAERRRVIAIMRRNNFSDQEIAATLGDQPEQALESGAAVEDTLKL